MKVNLKIALHMHDKYADCHKKKLITESNLSYATLMELSHMSKWLQVKSKWSLLKTFKKLFPNTLNPNTNLKILFLGQYEPDLLHKEVHPKVAIARMLYSNIC